MSTQPTPSATSLYLRLDDHCRKCPNCSPTFSCPQALRLWRAWRRAFRGVPA